MTPCTAQQIKASRSSIIAELKELRSLGCVESSFKLTFPTGFLYDELLDARKRRATHEQMLIEKADRCQAAFDARQQEQLESCDDGYCELPLVDVVKDDQKEPSLSNSTLEDTLDELFTDDTEYPSCDVLDSWYGFYCLLPHKETALNEWSLSMPNGTIHCDAGKVLQRLRRTVTLTNIWEDA